MRPLPYTGVTGVMCRQEVRMLLAAAPRPAGRLIMIGVLATDKTLRQEFNKRANRYPPLGRLDKIFLPDPGVLNLIHYATGEPATLDAQLETLTERGGGFLQGFQLNLRDPPPDQLRRYLARRPQMKIVLQIGGRAMQDFGRTPEDLAARIAGRYRGLVHRVLLDGSGGHGVPLDAARLAPYLAAIRARSPELGLGVAGGLGPDSLGLLGTLPRDFPGLSVDAEGRLRDEFDDLDLGRADEYLRRAASALAP